MSDIQDTPLLFLKRNRNLKRIGLLVKRGVVCVKERGFEALLREIDFRIRLITRGDVWKFRSDIPLKREIKEQKKHVFEYSPKISIVVPLYNTKDSFFDDMLKSVLRQSYRNFELVLVDASDNGNRHIENTVKKTDDRRIVYKKLDENRGISLNTNEGFRLCTGEYIALLDHDDYILPDALYENVKAINEYGADMLYSDEISLDGDLKHLIQYHFKIGYAPDSLRSVNYITHFLCFEKTLFEKAGAYESQEYDGAQDYDLILRLSEKAKCIYRIPKVLYYWRGHSGSTASNMNAKQYAFESGRKAIQAHIDRLGYKGNVEILPYNGSYKVNYEINGNPKVSVIIPSKDHTDDLDKCIRSIDKNAGWDNLEVLIVENNSEKEETFEYYRKIENEFPYVKTITYEGEFNFSKICNFGVSHASGEHILLLNNDIEFTFPDSVKEMLSLSQRKDVGAVGAKLIYPDDKLQHCGVIVGINGSAGHSHKGIDADTTGDMYRCVTVQNYLAVTGACLMTKKELYDAHPLDEENFAVAYNDIDYCLRLYEEGYVNVYTAFAGGYHYESKSRGSDTDKPNPRYLREKANFAEKWAKYFDYGDPYYNPHFTLQYENYGYK